MMHEEQLRIVQSMMLEYQKSKEEHVFTQILERVDKSLMDMVYKIAKLYYFTAPNIQDLYQVAILGLYKTIASVKSTDDSKWLMRRIFIYVRKEIFQEYGQKKSDRLLASGQIRPEKDLDSPVDAYLIQEDNIHLLTSLITRGIINEDDVQLIVLRYVDDISIQQITCIPGHKWGKSWSTVNNRIKSILKRIREEVPEETIYDL